MGAGAKFSDPESVPWTSGPWQTEAVGSHSSATAIGATLIATATPAAANSAANPNWFARIADLLVPAPVRVNLHRLPRSRGDCNYGRRRTGQPRRGGRERLLPC